MAKSNKTPTTKQKKKIIRKRDEVPEPILGLIPGLGDEVVDAVTGFKGTVTAITKWLTGCDTCNVTPKHVSGSSLKESVQIDITRLQVTKVGAVQLAGYTNNAGAIPSNGGPHDEAKSEKDFIFVEH